MTHRLVIAITLSLAAPLSADTPWKRHVIDATSKGADGVRLADANGDGLPDIATAWEQGGIVRLYLNPGPKDATKPWPAVTVTTAPAGEDAVLADLDGDGAVDVLSAHEGNERSLIISWAPTDRQKLLDPDAWSAHRLRATVKTQQWMYTLPLQIDGQHGLDIVAGGKNAGAAIGWLQAPANARQLKAWTWHELRPVGWLMSLIPEDMDGDGDLDVLFTDRKGDRTGAGWLENPGPSAAAGPWTVHMIGGQGREVMLATVGDLDGDGLRDVVAALYDKRLLWLRRNSKTGRDWQPVEIAVPPNSGKTKAVSIGDIDLDGRPDLVFASEYVKGDQQPMWWLKAPTHPLTDSWQPHELSGVDGVKDDLVPLTDLDGDGDLDVLTTEEVKNLGVIWYENPTRNARSSR